MRRYLLFVLASLLALSRLALADPGTDEARKAVDALLVRMSTAAKSSDKAAFLKCLNLSNPIFAAEQGHWCDDVVLNPVKEVTFSLADAPAPSLTDGQLHATLQIAYKSSQGAATDGTKAKWPALFIQHTGQWLYAGEDWQTLEGEGFSVKYFPESEKAAQMVLKAFPKAREHVNAGFGVKPPFQELKLFRNMAHLKATVYLNQPDAILMGWNEPGEGIKFMDNYSRDVDSWTGAYGHEYGHVATWEYGPGVKKSPWWVHEGVAELAAEDLIPGDREQVDKDIRRKAKAGQLVKWEEIADYDKAAQNVKHAAYEQGHHMLGFISDQWGREGRTRWLRALGAGKNIDEACEEVMGVNFADLDRAWRSTLPSPTPSDEELESARDKVDTILHEMATAAKEGDTQAWLKHVYKGDREFLNEQIYFAKDLKKKPPFEASITLGDYTLRGDVLDGPVTFTWQMSESKKERTVTFPARFIQAPGDDAEKGPVWVYAGETWDRRVSPGAVVMFEEGLEDTGNDALASFSSIRDHVETGFGLNDKALPRRTQKIKLYGSMKHLQQSICLSYEDGLGGWNEPGESIKLLVRGGGKPGGLKTVIAHEYGHVATFELGPKSNNMPWWILEGVADLSAEKYGRRGDFIERMSKAGKLAPWDELADFETVKKQYMTYVYQQGHHMLGYISDRWGKDKRIEWMTVMSNGKTLDEGTRQVLGMPFEQLDKEWRASLPPEEPNAPEDKDAAAKPEEKKAEDKATAPAGTK